MSDFNPSYGSWKTVIVKSFDGVAEMDITGMVTEVQIIQSMGSPLYRGSLRVLDTVGLLENKGFKIRGEESLELVLETKDLKQSRGPNGLVEIRAQVISVDNVDVTENGTGLIYTLQWISESSYKVGKRRIRAPFKDRKASDVVEAIFKKYFYRLSKVRRSGDNEIIPFGATKYQMAGTDGRHFYLQPTEGDLRCLIPNMDPTGAMKFLTNRSYSKDSPSCSFRFFETIDGYFYVTDEFLVKRGTENNQIVEEFSFNPLNSMDPSLPEMSTNTFGTFKIPNRVDTASDMRSGAYKNEVHEIDLTRRRAVVKSFDYLDNAKYFDMSGQRVKPREGRHSPEFIRDTFTEENTKRFIVYKDYYDQSGPTLRSNQYFTEIIQNQSMYASHLMNTMVTATITGRMDLRPGNLISVRVPSFKVQTNPESPYNEQLSGNYLIYSVGSSFKENILNTTLTLIKYDWSGSYEPKRGSV